MKNILCLILLLKISNVYSQHTLNLDFEYSKIDEPLPISWHIVNEGYIGIIDTTVTCNGVQSLRMESNFPLQGQYGNCSASFPVESVIGKTMEFKGRIKTKSVKGGYAGLCLRVDGKDKLIAFDRMEQRGVKGDTEWINASITMEIGNDAKRIIIGALLTGTGQAWFDDFEVFINGQKFVDNTPVMPTDKIINWLRKRIIPLKSFEPSYSNFEDLISLGETLEDAKIIALGESTHGSSEIFKMKHRLIHYLNKTKNFNLFSIEANLPEAYRINDYLESGLGDPKALIADMHFWTWNTQEILEMICWMRENSNSSSKIQFTGFDMQYTDLSINELRLNLSGASKEKLIDLENILSEYNWRKRNSSIVGQEKRIEKKFVKIINSLKIAIKSKERENMDWLLRNLRIIEQYFYIDSFKRDEFLAENVEWIFNQNRESKLVLWAHNSHVKKNSRRMGEYLSNTFKTDYVSIGFAFHEGKYTAKGDRGVTTYQAESSYPGTYEYIFQALNEPIFALDLREFRKVDENNRNLFHEFMGFRNVGSMNISNQFSDIYIIDEYDIIIYINKSTNSILLD